MPAHDSLPILTLDYLRSVTFDSAELIVELLDMFVEDGEMYLQQIEDATEQETLLRAVHTLKGTAGQVGALRLEALGRDAEKTARNAQEWQNVREQLPELRIAFQEVCKAIHDYKQQN